VSCCEKLLNKSLPTTKKRFAFAKACIKIWKKHMEKVPKVKLTTISPNCLKVDNATIFFASISKRAERLATERVNIPKINQITIEKDVKRPNRIKSQIPAVTKVELWTKALTGVGAAIAAGSHLIKGHWALLVKAKAEKTNPRKILLIFLTPVPKTLNHQQKTISKIASPKRLVSNVNKPPFKLSQFW